MATIAGKHPRPAAIALSVLAAACLLAWGYGRSTRRHARLGHERFRPDTVGHRGAKRCLDPGQAVRDPGWIRRVRPRLCRPFRDAELDRIAAGGAKADALIPVFPSLTFPSFYSIATGMYPEHHGIVGNRIYDPDLDESYSYQEPETVRDGRWYGGQPFG